MLHRDVGHNGDRQSVVLARIWSALSDFLAEERGRSDPQRCSISWLELANGVATHAWVRWHTDKIMFHSAAVVKLPGAQKSRIRLRVMQAHRQPRHILHEWQAK